MTKFVTITNGGFYWLAVIVAGVTYMLYKQGRVGDCISPGRRMRD